MCGIVGYIGHKEAFPILIKGLRRLEYRGYDSAGVALINDDKSVLLIPVGLLMVNLHLVMHIRTIQSRRILLSSIMVLLRITLS